ncbi:N-acetyl-gamma-glutamyl-phosphate reductase [Catalinimonas niigatensis]|uniref:N-acetyl-gamma-glutamyl-phosphate reductase n=1 Tax=Catalinimonas niigatensis TaxID=1397264 RepID=UPI0026665D73|nr:N-acetyl-gamma-glutamyl-phosphate reductase [Catalinimonas niigatensis]WPP52405.1 N-acetyl-gamma-glutamyl-phosphate reductase [Catalinimonas niigatensis]
MHKLKIGIIGATGYTGSELIRILHTHPQADIRLLTSESKAGQKISDIYPTLYGMVDQLLQPMAEVKNHELDVVFLALPHGAAMNFVKDYYDASFRIIDLSGDFRLSSPKVYEEWYGMDHIFPQGFETAVYGLPEMHRARIRQAKLVANPGCYPTASILATYPLVKNQIIAPDSIIVDAKSGITGAGVKPKSATHFTNVHDNFKPYAVKTHRHTVEIQETLSIASGLEATVQFTPHLLPIDRGIIATVYSQPQGEVSEEKIQQAYEEAYADEPFIRLRQQPPSVKDVRGSNFCDIFTTYDARTRRIITVSAIDNLVKGASGQAAHNMNLMFGFAENSGLQQVPINP